MAQFFGDGNLNDIPRRTAHTTALPPLRLCPRVKAEFGNAKGSLEKGRP